MAVYPLPILLRLFGFGGFSLPKPIYAISSLVFSTIVIATFLQQPFQSPTAGFGFNAMIFSTILLSVTLELALLEALAMTRSRTTGFFRACLRFNIPSSP